MKTKVIDGDVSGATPADDAHGLRVCMFVYNSCRADMRVLKEARSLIDSGYEVHIIAVLDKHTVLEEDRDGIVIRRIDRRPIHYRILWRVRRIRRWLRLKNAARRRGSWSVPRRVHRGVIVVRTRLTARARTPAGATRLPPPAASPVTTRATSLVVAAGRPYRAVRWRAIRRSSTLRRLYYGRRTRIKGHRAREDALRRREDARAARSSAPVAAAGSAGEQASVTAASATLVLANGQAPPAKRLGGAVAWGREWRRGIPGAAFGWIDRHVSRIAYRSLMAFHKPLMFTDYYRRADKLVRDEGFDVYHAHDLNTLPVAARLARRTGGRLVYDAHELYTEISTLSPRERRVWRLVERRLASRADTVITVCQSIARELRDRYRVPEPLILLNCPPRRPRLPRPPVNRLREKIGIHDDRALVLYQGGFAPNRGLHELISAARYVDGAVFVLMGWGAIEDSLRDAARSAEVEDRVVFTSPVSQAELLEFTQGADVGVIPYRAIGLNNYYTTPNKLFEYIAAGVPIAGSSFPELRRFVERMDLGVTFDPDSPRDIGLAVNYMLTNPLDLARMRDNVREASTSLVWENQGTKLVAAYAAMGVPR